jgi:Cytochrome P450
VCARLRQEIDTLDGRKPTYEELKNMKYLRAVLNESQRVYPIVPGNGRQAREDVVLPVGGGEDGKSPILVKKGQWVIFGIYSLHRRKDLYGEDAELFRPERWLDTEERRGLRMGWEYLPFSGGPRVCIGRELLLPFPPFFVFRNCLFGPFSVYDALTSCSVLLENFALTEVSYVTIRLLQEFGRLESRDPEPWRELITFICSSAGGCKVGLFPRDGQEKKVEV